MDKQALDMIENKRKLCIQRLQSLIRQGTAFQGTAEFHLKALSEPIDSVALQIQAVFNAYGFIRMAEAF